MRERARKKHSPATMIDISMESSFLLDSDFLIALYSADDAHHAQALRILEGLRRFSSVRLFLSLFVYGETVTVLSQRVAKKTAHFFMDDIEQQGASFLFISQQQFLTAQTIFRAQHSKNVSFVDAVNITFMREDHFSGLISLDRDYRKNGIRLYTGEV